MRMDLFPIAAAGSTGGGDLIVGLLLGICIGVLVGPAFRSWQAYREWADASREVRLADRLLERMEIDADLDEQSVPSDGDDRPIGSAWRTLP